MLKTKMLNGYYVGSESHSLLHANDIAIKMKSIIITSGLNLDQAPYNET